jgi:hypothetical protein
MASVSSPSNDGALTRYYTKVLSEADREKQAELKKIRERSEAEIKHAQDSYQSNLDKSTQDAENALNNARTDAQEAVSHERDHSLENLERLKEQTYNQRGQMEADRALDKKSLEAFMADSTRRYELEQKAHDKKEANLVKKLDDVGRVNDDQLKIFKDNQRRAFERIGEEGKKLNAENQKQADAQARIAIDHNIERDTLSKREIEQVNKNYQDQVDRFNRTMETRDNHYADLVDNIAGQKDKEYNEVIQRQNQNQAEQVRDLEKSFEKYASSAKKVTKNEEVRRDQVLDQQIKSMQEDKERGLQAQAKNYQEANTIQRKRDQATIKDLEGNLQKDRTSADVNLVSPQAETALRNTISKGFEKTLISERERNQEITKDLYQHDNENLIDAKEEFQSQITRANKEFNRAQASDRKEYYGSLLDAEMETQNRLHEKDAQSDRQTEAIHRHYSRLLEKQKRGYDNAFDSTRLVAQNKINDVRQEAELNLRLAHKEFVTKTNLMVKDYEKKMSEQKDNYEAKLDDMKTTNAMDLHNMEIKNKIELDSQAKNYETKIAQFQVQSKERERIVAQNFQDELDRTRHAYDLVLQKKS